MNGFICIEVFAVIAASTDRDRGKCDILWRDPLDVGDLVVLVVVSHGQENVLDLESKMTRNQSWSLKSETKISVSITSSAIETFCLIK